MVNVSASEVGENLSASWMNNDYEYIVHTAAIVMWFTLVTLEKPILTQKSVAKIGTLSDLIVDLLKQIGVK